MQPEPEVNVSAMQRSLLDRLMKITDDQAAALKEDDIPVFERLSEFRSATVQEAAAYLPPHRAWDPTLVEQVETLRRRSEQLQREIRLRMADVRRALVELSRRGHVTQYLERGTGQVGASWKG
ncbi:MAG: hypothetical protein ACRDG4_20985 [Chloroflexota bacterium]